MFTFLQGAIFWRGVQSAKLAKVDLVDLVPWMQRLWYLGCQSYPLPLPQTSFFGGVAADSLYRPRVVGCFDFLGQAEFDTPVALFDLEAIDQGNSSPLGCRSNNFPFLRFGGPSYGFRGQVTSSIPESGSGSTVTSTNSSPLLSTKLRTIDVSESIGPAGRKDMHNESAF